MRCLFTLSVGGVCPAFGQKVGDNSATLHDASGYGFRCSCLPIKGNNESADEHGHSQPQFAAGELANDVCFRHEMYAVPPVPDALRKDYYEQLKQVHDDLQIQRVRFHGIFSDDVHTYHKMSDILPIPGSHHFTEKNFRWCGVAYDNVLSTGMKPFVELSFIPKHMARKNKKGLFFYKPNISPPKDTGEWYRYIQDFLLFLVDRYSLNEVRQWYFEVWNEPNLQLPFFAGSQKDYFMPVFDWTRTQLDKKAPDGSTSLVMYWDQMNGLNPLKDDIHLPGWDSSYTQDEVRELISAYGELGEDGLWKNLQRFLKATVPVAEECGVRMAIHPDDPPYPIFGLPRIVTCEENLERLLIIVDSPANSLCLCTGSLGCAKSNDVTAMVRKYAARDRIAFMHIRNVEIMEDGSFEERAHLSSCGSLDIYEIVRALVDNDFSGYVRPDHGRMIWGETGKPGYGLYDRALGAAYINGLFEACEKNGSIKKLV